MQGGKTALDCDSSASQEPRARRRENVGMKALIIGAAGMIGRKLTARLVRDGKLAGRAITQMHLVDIVAPQTPANAPCPVGVDAFDIAAPYVAPKLIAPRPDIIFLLASVVSGEAEADFDK